MVKIAPLASSEKKSDSIAMAVAEALINAPEFTVSELSSALKRTVEETYGHVRVRGEITGFRGAHSSGHCYFALKDESAKIEAVIWRTTHIRMRVKPQEGLEVIATGKLTTYPGSSKYQIVIEALEPAGIGALMALMEARKRKLAAEGLFDEARKQLLPWLPEVIGVVTSPTSAPRRRRRPPKWRCRCAANCWSRSGAWRGGRCCAGSAARKAAATNCAPRRARCPR